MRWRGRQRKVNFLDVFTVVAFLAGESEEPLFKDWVFSVPEREAEAEPSLSIADAEQAIFSPTVGAAARMIGG